MKNQSTHPGRKLAPVRWR